MITTIYKCDKCGHQQITQKQMYEIQVTRRPLELPHGHSLEKSAHWCRMCMEAAHIYPPASHKEAGKELPPPPTLEDLVRQIVREEVA